MYYCAPPLGRYKKGGAYEGKKIKILTQHQKSNATSENKILTQHQNRRSGFLPVPFDIFFDTSLFIKNFL